MKVTIEKEDVKKLWWVHDLINDAKDNSIANVFRNVKDFLGKQTTYKYGRGGHHVWISDKENNRLILIEECNE